jgi:5-methylcytosine-specific restriction endonuclease McrA
MAGTYRDKTAAQKKAHHSADWKRARAAILRESDICWLCGREGADTVDHIVAIKDGGAPLDRSNLAPAHGKKQPWGCPGNYGRSGRKGPAVTRLTTSRQW